MNKFKVYVKGYGKINEAEIEIVPAMMFIGDNNSGKSYLMQLIWGMISSYESIFKNTKHLDEYKNCHSLIETLIKESSENKQTKSYVLNTKTADLFIKYFNKSLDINKDNLVKEILNTDSVSINHLEIKDFNMNSIETMNVSIEQSNVTDNDRFNDDDNSPLYIKQLRVKIGGYGIGTVINTNWEDKELNSEMFIKEIILFIIKSILFKDIDIPFTRVNRKNLVFLPAARTGFMLAYKDISSVSIKKSQLYFEAENEAAEYRSPYPLSVTRFLEDITSLSDSGFNKSINYEDVVSLIENDIYHGNLEIENKNSNVFRYKEEGLDEAISLHLTSSMITELAPLLFYLKSNIQIKTLIIEEPEAHLHLKAQKKLIKALSLLRKKGINIWITTHSDTVSQEISNLIKLKKVELDDAVLKKLDYWGVEPIDKKDFRAYQFDVKCNDKNCNKTEVISLLVDDYGIEAKSFNNEINKQIELDDFIYGKYNL